MKKLITMIMMFAFITVEGPTDQQINKVGTEYNRQFLDVSDEAYVTPLPSFGMEPLWVIGHYTYPSMCFEKENDYGEIENETVPLPTILNTITLPTTPIEIETLPAVLHDENKNDPPHIEVEITQTNETVCPQVTAPTYMTHPEPVEQTNYTEYTEPTEPTELTVCTDPATTPVHTDPIATTKPESDTAAVTTEPTEPIEPVVPTEATVPAAHTVPTEPTMPTEQTEPIVHTDPTEATEPVVNTEPTQIVCIEHDMRIASTAISAEYELYNRVVDRMECTKCGYVSEESHLANADVPKETIERAEADIVSCVNALRAERGLSQLWTGEKWDAWTDIRAIELDDLYGHERPNDSEDAFAADGYVTFLENVACDQPSGYDFYKAFFNSASHRDAMLLKEAVGISVSIYINEDGVTFCAMEIIVKC